MRGPSPKPVTIKQLGHQRMLVKCARIIDTMGGPEKALWEATASLHSLILNYPADPQLVVSDSQEEM